MQSKIQQAIKKDKETHRRFWQAQVKAWRKSGYNRAEYCRLHELSYDALTCWQKRTGATIAPEPVPSLVPVAQIPSLSFSLETSTPPALNVYLKDRFRIEIAEGFSPATLVCLINTLEAC